MEGLLTSARGIIYQLYESIYEHHGRHGTLGEFSQGTIFSSQIKTSPLQEVHRGQQMIFEVQKVEGSEVAIQGLVKKLRDGPLKSTEWQILLYWN